MPSFLSIFEAIRTIVRISFIRLWIFQQKRVPLLCSWAVYIIGDFFQNFSAKLDPIRIKSISIHHSTQQRNWKRKHARTWARSRARATIVIIIRLFPQPFDDLQMKLNKMFAFRFRNQWIAHMLCTVQCTTGWICSSCKFYIIKFSATQIANDCTNVYWTISRNEMDIETRVWQGTKGTMNVPDVECHHFNGNSSASAKWTFRICSILICSQKLLCFSPVLCICQLINISRNTFKTDIHTDFNTLLPFFDA